MEEPKKTISKVANKYEINTGTIFSLLTGSDEKWKKYGRQFLIKEFQDAIHSVLWQKNIFTVQYDGKNGTYLENYEEIRYPGALENSEDIRIFPFPEYFLKQDEESEYLNIVNYDTKCFINRWDNNFDLFFSLQFSLTEIVKGDESQAEDFLKYHLQNTFDNDFQKFKKFLENICLKYSEFLRNKYEPLVKRFIENEFAAQRESVSDVETKVSLETKKTVETIQLSIAEKVIPEIIEIVFELPPAFKQIECSAKKEEILDFFMILAKEKNNNLNKYYMKESDVEEFVKKNFAVFESAPTGKYFPINLTTTQKGRLRCFVTEFYIEYGSKTVIETRNYALLLVHNFEIFKDDNLASLINNMQLKKGPIKKNRIPIPATK